ncbi:MAG: RNA methyltransferase [Leptolinea sp.]|jgi:tRNA G18 (ribose-2'-O)-methylase SpoU|nr:RNA methyltransferase [Leptolinea sp.]
MTTADTHPDNDPFAGEGLTEEEFWFFECTSQTCRLRFPAPVNAIGICPVCRSPIQKKIACQNGYPSEMHTLDGSGEISVILDNLRSAYNVGSILRTSDGAGIRHAYLCGITPTPAHSRLKKTSLTAEIHTSWSYHPNGMELIENLKESGVQIFGLETSPEAENLLGKPIQYKGKIALVVGNEVCGIDPEIRVCCDRVLYLPMLGIKKSLNVAVSFGIAAYLLNRHLFRELPLQSKSH